MILKTWELCSVYFFRFFNFIILCSQVTSIGIKA